MLSYLFSRQSGEFLSPVQNTRNIVIVGNLNFWEVQIFHPLPKFLLSTENAPI